MSLKLANAYEILNSRIGYEADRGLFETFLARVCAESSAEQIVELLNDQENQGAKIFGATAENNFVMNFEEALEFRAAAFLHLIRLRVSRLDRTEVVNQEIIRNFLKATVLGVSADIRDFINKYKSQLKIETIVSLRYGGDLSGAVSTCIKQSNNLFLINACDELISGRNVERLALQTMKKNLSIAPENFSEKIIKQRLKDLFGFADADIEKEQVEVIQALAKDILGSIHENAFKEACNGLFENEPPHGIDITNALVLKGLEDFRNTIKSYSDTLGKRSSKAELANAVRLVFKGDGETPKYREGEIVYDVVISASRQAIFGLTKKNAFVGDKLTDNQCQVLFTNLAKLGRLVKNEIEQRDKQASLITKDELKGIFENLSVPAGIVDVIGVASLFTKQDVYDYLKQPDVAEKDFCEQEWDSSAADGAGAFRPRSDTFKPIETHKSNLKQYASLVLRLQSVMLKEDAKVDSKVPDEKQAQARGLLNDCVVTSADASNILRWHILKIKKEIIKLKRMPDKTTACLLQISKLQLSLECLGARRRCLNAINRFYDRKIKLFDKVNVREDSVKKTDINYLDTSMQQGIDLAYAEVKRISHADWQQHMDHLHINKDGHVTVEIDAFQIVNSQERFAKLIEDIDTTVFTKPKLHVGDTGSNFELNSESGKTSVAYQSKGDGTAQVSVTGALQDVVQAYVALFQARLVEIGVFKKEKLGDEEKYKIVENPAATAEQKKQASFTVAKEHIHLQTKDGDVLSDKQKNNFYNSLDSALKAKFGDYYKVPASPESTPRLVTGNKRPGWTSASDAVPTAKKATPLSSPSDVSTDNRQSKTTAETASDEKPIDSSLKSLVKRKQTIFADTAEARSSSSADGESPSSAIPPAC